MINISINVNKIDKDKLFQGKNGKYLNVTVDQLKEPDTYGNTHTVYITPTKEERAAKAAKVYLGSGKEFVFNNQSQQANQNNNYNPNPEETSDLPF